MHNTRTHTLTLTHTHTHAYTHTHIHTHSLKQLLSQSTHTTVPASDD